jgi:hypothetical protein
MKGDKIAEVVDEFVLSKMRKIKGVKLQKNDYWQNFKAFRRHLFPALDSL